MTSLDFALKRSFDLIVSTIGLIFLFPFILIGWILSTRDTGANGFFCQTRVGRYGQLFKVIKLRTMRCIGGTNVTTINDTRITPLGAKLRRFKLDELPQLWNVFVGNMSFVGPRPDVPGYMDCLEGEDRELLLLRPGITGPASLKYRNEEKILACVQDPELFNDQVIWPDKVLINREYMKNWTFFGDIKYIIATIFS